MDIAVDLVEVFLRVNGYLTLSEWQVQTLSERGQWETLTDIDILGVRFPGEIVAGFGRPGPEAVDLSVLDPSLLIEPNLVDVIIGEVKEGEAMFNPSIGHEETLKTALQRLAWLYDGEMALVCADVARTGVNYTPARGGGQVRTRLVAFGQATAPSLNVIPIGYILERSQVFLERFEDLMRSAKVSSPVAATLKLIHKSGFDLRKE